MHYVTTYCNRPHCVTTGKPVAHECYVLPPIAIQFERLGRTAAAIDEMIKAKPLRPHRGMRGPVKCDSRLRVAISYDTVSEDSARDGDHEDTGFIHPVTEERRSYRKGGKRMHDRNVRMSRQGHFDWKLRDALDYLKRQDARSNPWEAQNDGDSISVRVFGEYDPSCSAELQATYTLHLQGNVSTGTWHRLCRLLETYGARF
jgi:hypothetical protein